VPLVTVSRARDVVTISLARPEARNALSGELLAELARTFEGTAADPSVRAAVLAAEGPDFCAGADLAEMKRLGAAAPEENRADARRLAEAFRAIHSFPRPVVGRVHGNVLGGGIGLVAACDLAVVAEDVRMAFREVRLGILPAVISPYVVRRIGPAHARRLFLTGERFGAAEAVAMGLAAQAVPRERLEEAVSAFLAELRQGSPDAQHRIKLLLDAVVGVPIAVANDRTPEFIVQARASADGQEGLSSFLERRRPRWAPGDDA
jgi:methylglutaconyl-CoA hydratase